jgi:hypothetical protein
MINYSSSVIAMYCNTSSQATLTNVVTSVIMKFHAEDTDYAVTATMTLPVDLAPPLSEEFVPLGDLDESVVKAWVEGSSKMNYVYGQLEKSLAAARTDQWVTAVKLPWVTETSNTATEEPTSES